MSHAVGAGCSAAGVSGPTNAGIVGALRLLGLSAEEVQPGDWIDVWGEGCRRGWLTVEVDAEDTEEPLSLWVDLPDPHARICGGSDLAAALVMVRDLLRAGVACGYGEGDGCAEGREGG